MCIIVDTNCLSSVFERNSDKHSEFEPVFEWIFTGKGKLIFGGSKYIEELEKTKKYLKIINLLKNKGKAINIDKDLVDKEQKRIESLITNKDFDDPHLPALVIISKCKLICSQDTRSIKFVTNPQLYPKGIDIPKYYTSVNNIDLLCDKYIHDVYKPLKKLNRKEKEDIQKLL